ncbi:MAG: glutaredoxin domain-containing protein [Candidatus Marinimicrobia bacterium]|nr:glutaredoxin domain-containing protein [Candidatus Neomarinimicrobiota bacterium]MDP6936476.1 glutaredoxin domain-containing protein [Candidatus Neomarinimicrobiota bacterium]
MAAKKMLDDKGLSYKEINIEEEGISRDDLVKLTGGFTVPQILIDNVPIGGFDKLLLLDQTGKLKELLGHS